MNKYILFWIASLFLLLALIMPVRTIAANQSLQTQKLMTLSVDELLKKGNDHTNKSEFESAVVCYTIIVNRYDDSMSHDEKMKVVDSYEKLWNIYFNLYSDYTKAYECLNRIQQICDELKVQQSQMYIKYGAMFQVIYNLYGDLSKYKLSYNYYIQAFHQARKEHREDIMTLAYTNLLLVAYDLHMLDSLYAISKEYASYPFKKKTEYVANNICMYNGLCAIEKGEYDEAIEIYEQQIRNIPEDLSHVRLLYNNYLMLSRVEQCKRNYQRALEWIYKAGDVCRRFNIVDMNAELYNSLYKCYKDAGNRDSALHYRSMFLECKDQAMNYQNMQSFARMGFQNEINAVTKRMSEMKATEKFHKKTIIIVSSCLVIFIIMSIFIFLKNRRLAASFKSLYQKNVELMHIKERMEKMSSESTTIETKAHAKEIKKDETQVTTETKRSKLGQEEYEELLRKIKEVMRNTDYICNPDFSVEQLVSAVGAKYKTVLDVLHDDYGYNFSTILNKYRIDEACRRINEDEQIRNYTVEAIATFVGYRSRNSFTTAFKRITGLYPSEYIRLAKERQ